MHVLALYLLLGSQVGNRTLFRRLRGLASGVLVLQLSLLITVPCTMCATESPLDAEEHCMADDDGERHTSPMHHDHAAMQAHHRGDHHICCCQPDAATASLTGPPATLTPAVSLIPTVTPTSHLPASQTVVLDPAFAPEAPPPRA